jgi:hypothetical protein
MNTEEFKYYGLYSYAGFLPGDKLYSDTIPDALIRRMALQK